MRVLCVVGARPNYMKMAPVVRALESCGIQAPLVHTGQHYDHSMSEVFFDELSVPRPVVDLEIGSGSPAQQTARVMLAFEPVCIEMEPDLVLVAGDVNSTVSCALVAAKLHCPVGHVESGLRSFDRSMPEEVNRIVTDHLSSLLFVTEESGLKNLEAEGVACDRVHLVGNTMIDTLLEHVEAALTRRSWEALAGLQQNEYALATVHRQENVDDPQALAKVMTTLGEVARLLPVVFPVHPRTQARIAEFGLAHGSSLYVTDPLPYLDFLGLMAKAVIVLTDSGGVQEETTALKVPCLTLRENTERPATIEQGTNRLVGLNQEAILQSVLQVLAGDWPVSRVPDLWDGKASSRLSAVLEKWGGSGNHEQ